MLITYWGGDNNRIHDILIDGTLIATQELKHEHPNKFFDIEYAIPASLIKGKSVVTLKFRRMKEKHAETFMDVGLCENKGKII